MTDRELLELAAKAAGIDWIPASSDVGKQGELKFGLWLNIQHEPTETTRRRFNPLNDDGDALRLAVKLGLTVCNEHESAGSVCCTRGDDVFPAVNSGEVGDPPGITENDYAATRRGITLAAASIGLKL